MKHKFGSMGRVAIALVLALSLSLVMAVPASAATTDLTPDWVKAGDTDVPILTFQVNGGAAGGTVTDVAITYQGTDPVPDPTLITAKVYDDVTLLGSGLFEGGGTVTITVDTITLEIDEAKTLTLKYDLGSVPDGKNVDGQVTGITATGDAVLVDDPSDPEGESTIDNELNATVTLIPASSKGDTSVDYTLTVTDVETATDGAGISEVKLTVPASGGYAIYVVTNIIAPTDWSYVPANDGHGNPSIITWTADAGFEIAFGASKDFTFTATTPITEADYGWTVDTTDQVANTDSDTAPTTVDDTAPAAPVAELLVVTMNTSPTEDTIEGSAGAVEANATVKVYSDEALSTSIGEIAAAADGSFTAINIGDDTNAEVWVTATDAAGNESLATSKLNDIIGPPSIATIVGTTYQNGNDTIVITFDKDVQPASEGPWYAAVFAIKCGTVDLSLVGASFTPASGLTSTLTITLDEDVDYLVNGVKVYVTPAASAIKDAFDNFLSTDEQISIANVSGDSVAPTVALTYDPPDRDVKDADTLTITATFSEAMQDTPTIAIATLGDGDLSATDMSMGADRTEWVYAWDVASGTDDDGSAAVTITGDDLAGNAFVSGGPDDTFVIDNTVPTIPVANVVGLTSGAADTITITFSEDVAATDGDFTDGNEVAGITLKKTDKADVTVDLTDATFAYVTATKVLTITLAETGNVQDYLINGYTVTFDPSDTNTIEDGAGNLLDTAAIAGTASITGDSSAPTMDKVVGMIQTGDDTITITFSEKVRAADGTWSANEFGIESPAFAPLNIDHASFAMDVTNTILTITLNEAADGAFLVMNDQVKVTPETSAVLDLAGNLLPTTPATGAAIADPAYPYITSIVGTTILGAGDTIIITFSEAVEPADEVTPGWSADEFTITGLTLTTATFAPATGFTTALTITLDEATDADYLVNGDNVLVTPVASAIEDADGNAVPNTEVKSAAIVSGDTDAPTIVSIVGTIVPGSEANLEDVIRIDFSEAVVPVDASWNDADEFTITGADVVLGGATFTPASGITTTLTITLATGADLTEGGTLTVTPVENMVVDLAGNKMSDEVDSTAPVQAPSAAFVIDLEPDWNLISLPLVPTEPDIEAVLAGLVNANTVIQVRAFNTISGDFSIWASTGPFALNPTLTEMKDGLGFWIEMSTGDNLVASGSELPAPPLSPPSYPVYEGWNIIGFKSLTASADLVAYLGTLVDGTREAIYSYNASTGLYEIPTTFEPGYGYWLAVNNDGTIYP